MPRAKFLTRIAFLPVCGIIAVAGGCGNNPTYSEVEKEHAVNQAQARTAAYGKAGIPTGTGGASSQNKQAAARRGGR